MSSIIFLITGFLSGLAFLATTEGNELFIYAAPVAILALVFGILNQKPVQRKLTQKIPAARPVRREEEKGTNFKTDIDDEKITSKEQTVGKSLKKKLWMEVETEINEQVFSAITTLKWLMPHSKSIVVFFPGMKPQTFQMRVHYSDCNSVIQDVQIQGNQGLVGQLIKDNVNRILEGDLISSKTLYYYNDTVPVKSIAGVPIVVKGKRNGAIVIDSEETSAFNEDTIAALEHFAQLIGMYVYTAYMNSEHLYQKEQLAFLYYYQEKFFSKMSVIDIYDNIESYIKNSLPFDRILILALDENEKDKGRVVKSFGLDSEYFQNLQFSLADKGLLQVSFHKNRIIPRTIKPGETIYRISAEEQINYEFTSLLAVPVCIDQDSVEMVICIESTRIQRYTDHHIGLLSSLAGVAGFAFARARAYEQKHEQASKDGLTGLINHKTFQEKLRVESLRVSRMNSSFGIMMIDLDHFKSVNDTYGHPVGDIVLKETSRLISREVRNEVDIVARYGGEEFIIMLIDADETVVKDTAERIRSSIESYNYDIKKSQPLKCTTSIGYALFPQDSNNVKEVVGRADMALYKAKESGRNRVVGYH